MMSSVGNSSARRVRRGRHAAWAAVLLAVVVTLYGIVAGGHLMMLVVQVAAVSLAIALVLAWYRQRHAGGPERGRTWLPSRDR